MYEKPTVETPAPAKPAPVRPTSPLHDNDGKDEGGDDKQEDLYSFGASFPPHHLDIEDAPAGAVVGTAVSGPSILFRLGPDAAAAAVAVEDPSAEIAEVVAEAGRAGGVEAKGGADGDSQQPPVVIKWYPSSCYGNIEHVELLLDVRGEPSPEKHQARFQEYSYDHLKSADKHLEDGQGVPANREV